MTLADRVVSLITERSGLVVAVMLLLSVGMGAGMAFLDDSSGLDQFQFESEESEALDYIEANFEDGGQQTTTVQVVVRGNDVLTRDSFLETLELQQDIRNTPEINDTLATEETFGDLSNVVATTAIKQRRASALEQRRAELEQRRAELTETAGALSDGLNETRALEGEFLSLNASLDRGDIDRETYETEAERLTSELAAVGERTTAPLDADSTAAYEQLRSQVRDLQGELAAVEQRFTAGQISEDERDKQVRQLEGELKSVYSAIQTEVLGEEFATLEERGASLEAEATALESLDPTLDEQIAAIEGMNDDEIDEVLGAVLGEDAPRDALVFVPKDFERGATEADARQLFVTQAPEEEIVQGSAPEPIVDGQLAIADAVEERFGDSGLTFGAGIISDEINRSMADSMAIVLPLALLFVVVVLSIAYRDPLDIVLGLFGIALVLVWTFGFMGWTGISFNQIMIAVPVLLVGLSIDYAIHVFMRHREERTDSDQHTRTAMHTVLLGLGAALVWVTVTAVLGFLSNLVSPVSPIQEFGVVSAFGIASTLLIFATFVPAAKVGIDSFLEARGWDRRRRAFGTGGGLFTRVLSGGRTMAKRMPVVVVLLALLITAGGAYGAAQVDTTFQQEDFIAEDPPGWTEDLPEPFAPGEYTVKSNLQFVNDRFIRQDTTTQILLDGEITSATTLTDIQTATERASEQEIVATLSGEPNIQSPLRTMRAVAAENESFAATFAAADTDGDSVPDQNLTAVYDALFETAPDRASDVIYREDGEYESTRMVISMDGDATAGQAADATREIAETLDRSDRPSLATGQLVVFNIVEEELFNTVIESLLITMVTVFAFLMVAYRFVHGSATLGAVTLTPILLSVAWILGSMYLLGIPFNVMTGTITSLTIGLGVAYSIHMSERYRLELSRGNGVWESLDRAVTGTGGALLGSAATTAGGFGVLALAILPPLQDFGIITGLTIVYAFLASVFVLPSLLVLWTRYFGPDESVESDDTDSQSRDTTTDDGPATTVTEYDPANEDAPDGEWRPSMGTRPAAPTRTVDPPALEPGSSYTATVTVPLESGLTSLREEPPGEVTAVETFGPEPLKVTATDGTVKAQWDSKTQTVARVRFTGRIPDAVTGDATFEGTVSMTDDETTVGGDTALDVTARASEE
ncbi:Predicted exporter protein, RND superfamily [Halovenus aranensis]|uniref:Predicted exporter protein, RND superfamily n=1 Tax=Halovenus aranensis TaxID=890420 RepID=A0A1G8X443_9EURY|nr:MMPL family transporter [Halovenus aranensis]SDJ85117.1 Predicted exporter protein, RND superfamily [Halovenus aranensis]